jgi:small subunit ribosomal protein S17
MRNSLKGVVIKAGSKTASVKVERWCEHPLYHKKFKRHKKFNVDTAGFEVEPGYFVEITETSKKSKTKNFRISKILAEAKLLEEVK